MFIAMNTIKVPEAQLTSMQDSFRKLAPELKKFDGFLGFEVWQHGEELVAVSRWESKEAFEQYPKNKAFRRHHGGMEGHSASQQAQLSFFSGEVVV